MKRNQYFEDISNALVTFEHHIKQEGKLNYTK